MISFILGVIGFLVTEGTFGAQVIGAASLMEYWLWFTTVLASIFAVVIFLILAVGGGAITADSGFGKLATTLGGIGGGLIGALLGLVVVGISLASLWLSNYIQHNVDPTVTEWTALAQNDKYAIVALGVLIVISILRSLKSTGGSK
jgi:hypothetical protein